MSAAWKKAQGMIRLDKPAEQGVAELRGHRRRRRRSETISEAAIERQWKRDAQERIAALEAVITVAIRESPNGDAKSILEQSIAGRNFHKELMDGKEYHWQKQQEAERERDTTRTQYQTLRTAIQKFLDAPDNLHPYGVLEDALAATEATP